MQIDWKHLANTPGYKSLKATYIKAVVDAAKQKRPMRDKAEYLRKFYWIINRAKHYAYHTGETIESVLNEWEEKRSYCWLNYYQPSCQPKFHSKAKKPMGLKGIKAYYKKSWTYDPQRAKRRIMEFIKHEQGKNSAKIKKRWSTARKKRDY